LVTALNGSVNIDETAQLFSGRGAAAGAVFVSELLSFAEAALVQ
jgi:hypothetical protein